MQLQKKYTPPGKRVHNSLQTNGILLDDRRSIEERLNELHILGLGVEPRDLAFEAVLERQRGGRARRITLTLVLHNHQPVGNFGFVLEETYQKAYAPMLDALERHPGVRLGRLEMGRDDFGV